jgi:hypothetical protein
MRKNLPLLFLAFLFCHVSWSQKISIEGTLTDSVSTPLPSATVLLLLPKDSSLVTFAPSDGEGKFIFRNVVRQAYLLKVSYVGFSTYMEKIEPDQGMDLIQLGRMVLHEQTAQLSEVTINGEKIPVVIKKDTIEFNAGSFKTKQNAMVEDLLKKLPGVEVDNDGTIRAQGKEVQRVTVDGKNFFGTDPKLATRNLPADAVSKVQVFDKKSDQAAFTGIDDGQKEKTINLELKEEKRKGAFGQITAGAGDDSRYLGKASINKFQKTKQLSLLGLANNINEQGFGIEDYMNFSGGSQAMMSGRGAMRIEINNDNQNGVPLNFGNRPNGIMTSYAGGINFNQDLSKNTELNTSYFYNHLDHLTIQNLFRENFFTAGNLNYNQQSEQVNANDNHRLNFSLDHKIDSMNSIKLTATVSYNETDARENSNGEMATPEGETINAAEREVISTGATARLTSSLLWRHKFARKGRTFSTNVQYSGSDNNRDTYQDSFIFDGQNENHFLQDVQQLIANNTFSTTFSYTEPLGKRKYLEGNYSYRLNKNSFSRDVFDLLENSIVKNDSISSAYTSAYDCHRAGINFRMNRKNFNLTAGASVQNASLNGTLKANDSNIRKTFNNVLPVIRFDYNFTNTKDLRIEYETNVEEPGIQQLQPVVDNSDPLNLYVGNPNLRPSYSQNLRANFGSFNPLNFINLFAYVEATYTTNAITVSQSVDGRGVRLSQPVNVRDNRSLNGNVSFGFPIEKLKSRVSLSTNMRYSDGLTIVDDYLNRTIESTISGRIRYDLRIKEIFDFAIMANISRQSAEFGLASQMNQLYFNNTYTADANLTFLKNFTLSSAFEFLSYSNRSNGYSQHVPLLNFSLSRFILKGNSGEIKASVSNVLDKGLGVTQSTGLNYIERSRMNALGRYVMLSFTYTLNKQLNPMGMRPRGRMMRIIR